MLVYIIEYAGHDLKVIWLQFGVFLGRSFRFIYRIFRFIRRNLFLDLNKQVELIFPTEIGEKEKDIGKLFFYVLKFSPLQIMNNL